jgi:altronate dehydratase
MDKNDNCATSLMLISQGEQLKVEDSIIVITNQIPVGHKFAIQHIKKGEMIIKYGKIIGVATEDINMGDWIHIHNIKSHYLEVSANE